MILKRIPSLFYFRWCHMCDQDLRSLTRDRTRAPLQWEHRALNRWTAEFPQSDLKENSGKHVGFPQWLVVKQSACQWRQVQS